MATKPPPAAPPTDEQEHDEQEREAPAAPPEHPFFSWLRRLDVPRRPGWIGGVCAGIADRLGIDPLIVRGIAVVIAVLGGPVALLYAAAWFLLPDTAGTIHAQELGRGRANRALAGIVALAALSLLPLAQGFWYLGGVYWGAPDWASTVGRALWTAVVITLAIVLIVWLARRGQASAVAPDVTVTQTPATTDDRPDTVPSQTAPTPIVAATAAPGADAGAPPPPPDGASAEELAAWKESQAAWQEQRSRWAAEQQRDERERARMERERVRAEVRAQAAVLSAAAAAEQAERRRVRRLTRPRASSAAVFAILGVAVLAGAGVALASGSSSAAWALGAATTTILIGAGIVIVGLARRRSGALAFFGLVAACATMIGTLLPADRELVPLSQPITAIPGDADGRWAVLAGGTTVHAVAGDEPHVVDLWQAFGSVDVAIPEDATVRIVVTGGSGDNYLSGMVGGAWTEGLLAPSGRTPRGENRYDATIGEGEPDLTLHVWLGASNLRILLVDRPETMPPVDPPLVNLYVETPDPMPSDPAQPEGENG